MRPAAVIRSIRWVALIGVAVGTSLSAQRSPFNGLSVVPADTNGTYRFLVSGHFYGGNAARSGFMASTLLANIDTINASGASFFLTTGDLFIDAAADKDRARRSFFGELRMPLFNAVGNHDLDGGHYGDLYGATSFAFDVGWDRYVILDTERDDGRILDDQLKLIADAAAEASAGSLRHLFVISHRPVWAEEDERYEGLFVGNTRSLRGTDYAGQVLPLLRKAAGKVPVFWISGSLGGGAQASFFFDEPEHNIHYVITAIRDEPRDAILIADVAKGGVTWSGVSLTGRPLMKPEKYDLAWWQAHSTAPIGFRWRLLPYYIKTTLLHRAFWIGVISTVLLLALARLIFRRRT